MLWQLASREEQRAPSGDWQTWFYMAGRGSGKTRSAAEDVKDYGLSRPRSRIGVCAPTVEDARDICFEGESGLLSVMPRSAIRNYNRSIGELHLTNGTLYRRYSAEKPGRFRGPQFHRFWGDEIAEWRYPETYDNMLLALRLGKDPQAVLTGTPKPVKLVRDVYNDPLTVVTHSTTYANRANLADRFFHRIAARYEGTSRGEQEILGKLLDELPGALWSREMIERGRVRYEDQPSLEDFQEIVVAIDPQAEDEEAETEEQGSETGIVVAGRIKDHAWIIADISDYYSPNDWALAAATAYHQYEADYIVAEVNQGGAMVRSTLRTVDNSIPIRSVRAKRGKALRADPVVSAYQQGRVHHVGVLGSLESQQTSFRRDKQVLGSDRVDAAVYACTHLIVKSGKERGTPAAGFRGAA